MINGFGASVEMWGPFWKQLARSYQVVLFDNRGTGRSTVPDAEYSIKMMADDVAGLMDELEYQQAHIFGASMGGMIAQELVLAYPTKVLRLILSMTTFGGPHSVPVAGEVQQKMMTASNPPPTMSTEEAMELWWSIVYSPAFVEAHRDTLMQETQAIKYPTTFTGKWRQAQAVMSWKGTYERLPDIHVPCLIMAGEKDVLFHPENARILAERIPRAKLHVFRDAPHAFTREQEDLVVPMILEFLAGGD